MQFGSSFCCSSIVVGGVKVGSKGFGTTLSNSGDQRYFCVTFSRVHERKKCVFLRKLNSNQLKSMCVWVCAQLNNIKPKCWSSNTQTPRCTELTIKKNQYPFGSYSHEAHNRQKVKKFFLIKVFIHRQICPYIFVMIFKYSRAFRAALIWATVLLAPAP